MNYDESKPWLREYDSWVPSEINPDEYENVVDMLIEAGDRFADSAAFSSFGAMMSYASVIDTSRDFAAYLQNELGVRKGDRIALMAPNIMAFPIIMLGILRAGAVQVNVNPLYTARELQHQLTDADVETIVVFAGSSGTLADIVSQTPIKNVVSVALDDFLEKLVPSPPVDARIAGATHVSDAVKQGTNLSFDAPPIHKEDLIFLQYTGGTTGLSKGAMLTHGNLVSNMLQFKAFAGEYVDSGKEVVITAIPMYHIFALMVNTLSYFWFGATNVLIANPRDMKAFVAEWSKWPVTVFTGVNTLYNCLLHTEGFSELDFSTLKISIGGGAPVQKIVSDRWKEVTGRHIKEGYGLSETSPVLTLNPFARTEFASSIGVPVPSTEIELRDDDGVSVLQGESGELCARGPQVMKGYWRRADATREVTTDDGFFKTGDIAEMDKNGFFRIVDRKKDMILVSGFNVYPNEIEAEVAALNGIVECACVGVPDNSTGEAAKLFVVKLDESLTAEAILDHCRDRLTPYKVPKQIVFIEELPKSTVGKILRRELRDAS